jgi:hypothetical protein
MIRKLSLPAIALVMFMGATPAAADFYIELGNGRYLVMSDLLVLFVGVVVLLGVVGASSNPRAAGAAAPISPKR